MCWVKYLYFCHYLTICLYVRLIPALVLNHHESWCSKFRNVMYNASVSSLKFICKSIWVCFDLVQKLMVFFFKCATTELLFKCRLRGQIWDLNLFLYLFMMFLHMQAVSFEHFWWVKCVWKSQNLIMPVKPLHIVTPTIHNALSSALHANAKQSSGFAELKNHKLAGFSASGKNAKCNSFFGSPAVFAPTPALQISVLLTNTWGIPLTQKNTLQKSNDY